jgi:hypothetical protein
MNDDELIEPSEAKAEDPKQVEAEESRIRLDRLEKENQELRSTTAKSLEEAAAARGQVSVILEQIQRAASQGDQDAQKAVKTLRDKFDEDPVSAMNDLVTMRVGPMVQEYFERQVEVERDTAKRQHGKQFEKYADEIEVFMKDMPLDVKAKAGSFSAALKYVRSQHLDEELEEARKEERERASRPEGASTVESAKERRGPVSREEREIMKAFEMSEDDWQHYATPGGERPRKKEARA